MYRPSYNQSMAQKPTTTLLTFGDQGSSGGFRLQGGRGEVNSLPTQAFVKDLIQVGVYEHPVDDWKLNVTPEKMDEWIATSKLMAANGVDAEVVKDHSFRADAVLGKLTGLFREENDKGIMTLYGVHTLIGEDSIELAQKVGRVSIWLEPNFVDGKGRSYGEAILHSSIVQQPVVPDQQDFVPIAASSGLAIAASMHRVSNNGDTKMDLTKWAELLGLDNADDLTEDNLLDKAGEHVKALGAKHETELSDLKAKHDTKIKDLKAKAAGTKPVEPDPDTIEMMVEGVEAKIEGLVSNAKISPKVAASLKDILVGKPGARNARALSRVVSGDDQPMATRIIAALEENELADLKERTGSQVLSRQTPGGPDMTKSDDAIVERMLSGAGNPKKQL